MIRGQYLDSLANPKGMTVKQNEQLSLIWRTMMRPGFRETSRKYFFKDGLLNYQNDNYRFYI